MSMARPLHTHPTIFRLDLGYNAITGRGIKAVAALLLESASLLCLDLSGNNLYSRLSMLARWQQLLREEKRRQVVGHQRAVRARRPRHRQVLLAPRAVDRAVQQHVYRLAELLEGVHKLPDRVEVVGVEQHAHQRPRARRLRFRPQLRRRRLRRR